MSFCHPLNTPRSAQVCVSIAVPSPQLRIEHFPVPGSTTMPTVSLLATEVKEEKEVSAFPNLCFCRYRYLPRAGFQYLYKIPPTICAAVTGHICCVKLNCVQVATQSKTTLNLGLCRGVAAAGALQEATGDSLQVPGLHFPTRNQRRVSLILHPWGLCRNQWFWSPLWVTKNLWKDQENLYLSEREHQLLYSGLQVDV